MWWCSTTSEKKSNALMISCSGAEAQINAYKKVFLMQALNESGKPDMISEYLWKNYVDVEIEVAGEALHKERRAAERLFQSATDAVLPEEDQWNLSLCTVVPKPCKDNAFLHHENVSEDGGLRSIGKNRFV